MKFNMLKKTKIDKEYIGLRKIIYEDNLITIINYGDLITINNSIIDLKDLIIKGDGLKVLYQDPVRIRIKGNISEVLKK